MVIEIIAQIPPNDNPSINDLKQKVNDQMLLNSWTHFVNDNTKEKLYISSDSTEKVNSIIYHKQTFFKNRILAK